jgi:hypothetical protein
LTRSNRPLRKDADRRLSQLLLQLSHRARVGERQSGLQGLGGVQLLARDAVVAGAGLDFCRHIVRLATLRVITQHLRDHLLRLGEIAAAGRLIDLCRGRVSGERRQGAGKDEQSAERQGDSL